MKDTLTQEVQLISGVEAKVEGSLLHLKGPKGEVSREFVHPKIELMAEGDVIKLTCAKATKREKTVLNSYYAHIKNMVQGVSEPFVYIVRICSGHFPMNVSVSGNELVIKNFLGESVPRRTQLVEGVSVKINGNDIVITSSDKEKAGVVAGRIENLTRITNRDRRIFQDGCYIVEKAGKSML